MLDIGLTNGDIAISNNDVVTVTDVNNYLMKSLGTPQGLLSQLAYDNNGKITEIDTTYGNAIFSMLSEPISYSLMNDMRQAVVDASLGAATDVTLQFLNADTVNTTVTTNTGLIQFVAKA
jgi:hypothetical protein